MKWDSCRSIPSSSVTWRCAPCGGAGTSATPCRRRQRGVRVVSAEPFRPTSPAGPSGAFERGQEAAAREQLFNRIAPVYDQVRICHDASARDQDTCGNRMPLCMLRQLNDVLSLGLHRVWKRAAVKWSGAAPGDTALDVCCGSGDLALRLAQAVGIDGSVTGLDFAQEMLDDAAARDRELPAYWDRAPISWTRGDARQLPFDDASFDAATVGYGLRNVADVPMALSELRRVLRPGAKVAVLDFNNSGAGTPSDEFQGWALENVVVPAARLYGLQAEYEYLRPSIQRFPTGRQQEQLAMEAGFESATHYELAFGIMGCLVARTPQ